MADLGILPPLGATVRSLAACTGGSLNGGCGKRKRSCRCAVADSGRKPLCAGSYGRNGFSSAVRAPKSAQLGPEGGFLEMYCFSYWCVFDALVSVDDRRFVAVGAPASSVCSFFASAL
jgi:hypothetical protein